MGRLTKHTPDNFGYAEYQLKHGVDEQSVISRLATYEDTGLEPEVCANYKAFEDEAISKGVTFKRIVELMEAERDGRLVELPCKVGDTAYVLGCPAEPIEEWTILHPSVSYSHCGVISTVPLGILISSIGKTIFLTREEAEAALKESNA